MTLHTTERLELSWPLLHSLNLWYTWMQYDMLNLKFQNIQRQSAWAPGNTISSLPKRDFLDTLSKSLPRCDILWHFWKRWGQNQCQTPTTSPWPNYPSKKIIDMSDVLFDSLYDSELPNMKGCAQWKIKMQLFGKGGSVIVTRAGWVSIRHLCRRVTICDIFCKARVKNIDRLLQSAVGHFLWSKKCRVRLTYI